MVENSTCVVVGATGTIGGAVTRKLLGRGFRVVAVGRDETKLKQLADESELVIPCRADIGDSSSVDAIKAAVPGPVAMSVMAAGLPARPEAVALHGSTLAMTGGRLRGIF
ncbi:MAG TPA: SDR family NAD(P)-dependent oxidoreductase [Pseudonocardia sp.]|jgi:NADP-dependent 3-hydroxy acid dehydrogenase YdfG